MDQRAQLSIDQTEPTVPYAIEAAAREHVNANAKRIERRFNKFCEDVGMQDEAGRGECMTAYKAGYKQALIQCLLVAGVQQQIDLTQLN